MPGEPINNYPAPISKVLHSSDGCEIYAEATGNPNRPHVVLVHGFTFSGAVFDEFCQLPLLLEGLYIVRYDTRGHGRSGKPDTPDAHLSRLYADDFMAVVHAFALKNPIFVSWSNGGLIAADICANVGPLPISGIFYLSALPHAFSLITGGATPYLLSVIASCEDLLTTTAGLLRMVDGCFASPHALPPTFQLRCFYAGMQTLQSKEVRNAAARRSQDVDKLWENMELGLPVCAMYGSDDILVDGKVLEREVRPHAKNFDVKVVEGRGHALFWEIPQDTAKVIIEFVTRAWKDTYDDVSA